MKKTGCQTLFKEKWVNGMNVLMVGVDQTFPGGMFTVAENYLGDEEFCKKTNLIYVPTATQSGKLAKIRFFLKALARLVSLIHKRKIDIVHIHMAERGSVFREGFVAWLAKRMGTKTVIHMHGATIEDWYDRQAGPTQKLASYLFGQADKMIVLGYSWLPFMERAMGTEKKDRISVLHNAVPIWPENRYDPDALNLLFYGVLVPRKGIDDLLRAYQSILEEIPENIILTIYGADIENNILAKIKAYHLEGRAVYCGWMTSDEREQCFSKTMLHILPSYNEGLPMTILETMAFGIPNIATDIAAIPEAITDGENGRLVSSGAPEQLARIMKELIGDPGLRREYSRRAYRKAKEEFSLQRHLNDLYAIYQSLLE